MNSTIEIPRVLYINGGPMDMGGISSYMMNYYRHIDKTKMQIDFIVHGASGVYDEEIENLGGIVYHIPTKRDNLIGNIRGMNSIMRRGNYKIVHSHMDGMNGLVLKKAKRFGIPIRISHSHNIEHLTTNKIKRLFHEYSRKIIGKYATVCMACSHDAGKWLYGVRQPFEIVHNAIDAKKYAFDLGKRRQIRESLHLEEKYVIGHIGRFDYQKNHQFLLSIFAKVIPKRKDALLLLIGDGALRADIEKQIEELKLEENVLLLGERSDVPELLSAMDVFVLPSKFEGLGIVAIEAQTNGLHCVCSDQVPEEVNITDNVDFLSLTNEDEWVGLLIESRPRKENAYWDICKAGYEIEFAVANLQNKYLSMVENKL